MWGIRLLFVFQYILVSAICNVWIVALISSQWMIRIITCVLINYDKCKIQLLNNGFNMLKFDSQFMYHVDSWRNVKKIINPL
jgi:hypothetical protein